MVEKYSDLICPFCGNLCDDIEVTEEDGKLKTSNIRDICRIGHAKFEESINDEDRLESPLIRKNGELKPVSLDEAIEKAAEILKNSNYPIGYGWSSTTCETIETGVKLIEKLGGVMDNTSSVCHGPSILAEQGVGVSTCTLGQVKNRADLIIYWGCNPAHAHPRHICRYATYSNGFFRRGGKKDRKMVVIDIRYTDTAKIADEFVQVNPNKDYELLNAFRTVLNDGEIPNQVAGVSAEKIKELTEQMANCEFGTVFFGLGLTMSEGKFTNIDNAISLVRDLNDHTKFTIMPMRGHYNVAGANIVTTWQSRFPYAVDFARGYPRYAPGANTVVDVLGNKEADSALVVASDPAATLPKQAVDHFQEIPSITIDPHMSPTAELSDVVIPSAVAGIEATGTAYRMDGVPIRLKKIKESPENILPDEEILEMIYEKIIS